ncbi:MAG TPA: BTAD domain-containing putative transcriptional regulator [Streptosporangiaceae bacterium]
MPIPAAARASDTWMTGAAEFGLLGPLTVRRDGAAVVIPAGKQRALLAALLLSAGRPVGIDTLAGVLWGSAPPPSARVSLQNYVLRLRRSLAGPGPSRIVTEGSGYRIDVGPGELDVERFESQLAAGRAAARAGDWAAAAAALAEGLALWRGEPLAGVPAPALLARERPRLRELHLQAVEARIEADLHVGRPGALIAELRALTAAQPLRERGHVLLITALDQDGQAAEALAAYAAARRVLAEELGADPGIQLQELYARLRAGPAVPAPREPAAPAPAAPAPSGPMPALLAPAPPAARQPVPGRPAAPAARQPAPAPPAARQPVPGRPAPPAPAPPAPSVPAPAPDPAREVPRQLPAAAPQFAGRGAELDALAGQLSHAGGGTVVISAIAGTAGVGKTTLAVYWAHQVAGQFPDGQLYIDLRGFAPGGEPVAPQAALHGLLGALGIPAARIPPALADQEGLYRTLLAGRRVLVLLDNAADAEQVRPLLPGSPGCLVLVTSRRQLSGLVAAQGALAVYLDVMPAAEARELLARRLGRRRVAAEPAAVAELIDLCAGLPLALAIAASRPAPARLAAPRPAVPRPAVPRPAATRPPDRPLAALAAELRAAVGPLDALATGDTATDVRAVLSWSGRHLTEPAARLFRLLGVHPGPDISAPAAASLAALPPAGARDALRELARAHLITEPSRGRFAMHDLLRAYAAEQSAAPGRADESRAARLRAADHYVRTGCAAAMLLSPVRVPLALPPARPGTVPENLAGRPQAIAWLEAEHRIMLALAGAAGLDASAWPLAWSLAGFLQWRGEVPEYIAVQRAGLAAAERLGDLAAQAQAHYYLGLAMQAAGQDTGARAHMARSLAVSQRAGDAAGELRGRAGLGFAAASRGDYGEALEHAHEVLRQRRADPAAGGLGQALSAVGWYYALSGQYARALPYCEEALALERGSAEPGAAAGPLDSVGYIHHHLGDHGRAIACYREALALYRERGGHHERAEVLIHLATRAARPATRTGPGRPGRRPWTCWPARTPTRPARSRRGWRTCVRPRHTPGPAQ